MVLSDADVGQFIERGYVLVSDCFTREVAREWSGRAFARLKWNLDEPATWEGDRIYLHTTSHVPLADFSPRLWQAVCQLLGGAGRVRESFVWDSFIVNLQPEDGRAWEPPSASLRGWHIDGDSFRHFLDSPENALVALFHWTDAVSHGGCTFVACDSIPVVARFLARHEGGLLPREFTYGDLIRQCREFREVVAEAGSVLLLHPLTLHAASSNSLGVPRIITNTNIQLREPKVLQRPHAADYSPVERAILRGLGVERYDFRPVVPREQFTSPRVLEARRMRGEGLRRQDP